MRILLLSPKSNFPDVTPSWLRIPQLTLLILAGLTPPEHEVLTVEEEFESLPLEEHWDAVRTLEFLFRNSVPSISPCILTPYPGTPLFERLMREGRILHTNWSYYDHTTVCYQPKSMDPEELGEKYLDFRKSFFSCSSIIRRGYAQLRVAPLTYFGMNLALHKTTNLMGEHFRTYSHWLRQQRSGPTLDGMKKPTVQYPHGTRRVL
jgi:hypothetical protein